VRCAARGIALAQEAPPLRSSQGRGTLSRDPSPAAGLKPSARRRDPSSPLGLSRSPGSEKRKRGSARRPVEGSGVVASSGGLRTWFMQRPCRGPARPFSIAASRLARFILDAPESCERTRRSLVFDAAEIKRRAALRSCRKAQAAAKASAVRHAARHRPARGSFIAPAHCGLPSRGGGGQITRRGRVAASRRVAHLVGGGQGRWRIVTRRNGLEGARPCERCTDRILGSRRARVLHWTLHHIRPRHAVSNDPGAFGPHPAWARRGRRGFRTGGPC